MNLLLYYNDTVVGLIIAMVLISSIELNLPANTDIAAFWYLHVHCDVIFMLFPFQHYVLGNCICTYTNASIDYLHNNPVFYCRNLLL